jgi:hypothetical protein
MATRQSIDRCLLQCEDALGFALNQYREGAQQEHYNDLEYTEAQSMLEDAVNDIAKLSHSANDHQREALHRMRLQVQQMQNNMILLGQNY